MNFAFKNIDFTYPGGSSNALKEINFQVDSSMITGLIGANGSGKSTLIKVLLRQIISYSGVYEIDGKIVDDRTGSILGNFGIGYAPEDVELDDLLTGYEILTIVKEIRDISEKEFSADIEYLSSMLLVDDWLNKKRCSDYSQGMRRKLSIMIALIGPVRFAVLDEPNNGLDPLAIAGLKKILVKRKSEGVGTLISTHILDIIDKISDNVVMLRHGSLLYSGSVLSLRNSWPEQNSLEDIYCEMHTRKEVSSAANG